MRLLHTTSFRLKTFYEPEIPPYAILSHTWGRVEDEISFQELHDPDVVERSGYIKIRKCCEVAANLDGIGYEWVWIDTCCIDKTNLTELSEAINSMWNWYKGSGICLVFLSDVRKATSGLENTGDNDDDIGSGDDVEFKDSRWFTRGWTLQELVAPSNVQFFDRNWVSLGRLVHHVKQVEVASGISWPDVKDLGNICVGVKMSWFSKRSTTRLEDMAYCMLGIFGINLPLIYGEGDKAFLRLQREIFQTSPDETLFAWSSRSMTYSGLLAPHPSCFLDSGNVRRFDLEIPRETPLQLFNRGVRIKSAYNPHCTRDYSQEDPCRIQLALRCTAQEEQTRSFYMCLIRIGVDTWARFGEVNFDEERKVEMLFTSRLQDEVSNIYVPLWLDSNSIARILAVSAEQSREPRKIVIPRLISFWDKNTPVSSSKEELRAFGTVSIKSAPPQCEIQADDNDYRITVPSSNIFFSLTVSFGNTSTDIFIANLSDRPYMASAPRKTNRELNRYSSHKQAEYAYRVDSFNEFLKDLMTHEPRRIKPCCVRSDVVFEFFALNHVRLPGPNYFTLCSDSECTYSPSRSVIHLLMFVLTDMKDEKMRLADLGNRIMHAEEAWDWTICKVLLKDINSTIRPSERPESPPYDRSDSSPAPAPSLIRRLLFSNSSRSR